MNPEIKPAQGKLGILTVGLGAVSTTLMAGVLAIRNGTDLPIGSYSQLGTIRLGKRTEKRNPLVKDFVPLASLNDIVFGAWDIFEDNAYESALTAGVLDEFKHLHKLKAELEQIKPMTAVFDPAYVRKLNGQHVKKLKTKMEQAEALMQDIRNFMQTNQCSRTVMIWCASTEVYIEQSAVHQSLEKFEEGLRNNDPAIAPSMIYTYASLKCGVPYANGAPNLSCDIPAMEELALMMNVPIAGKDFKTGQTLMKTILAPGLKIPCFGYSWLVLDKHSW